VNRILIAEDEGRIASFLEKGLRGNGFVTAVVEDGVAAYDVAASGAFDLLILDIGLPLSDGFTVLRRLREAKVGIPVIILTARDSVTDTVAGLEGGADDYIAKPFDFEELLARLAVQQVRRRDDDAGRLAVGGLMLDLGTRTVANGEHRSTLTEREAELLALLMRNAGRPLTRSQIFEAMWAGQGGAAVNVVDVYIGYLRRKLSPDGGSNETPIRTIRGRGFLLAVD